MPRRGSFGRSSKLCRKLARRTLPLLGTVVLERCSTAISQEFQSAGVLTSLQLMAETGLVLTGRAESFCALAGARLTQSRRALLGWRGEGQRFQRSRTSALAVCCRDVDKSLWEDHQTRSRSGWPLWLAPLRS